MTLESVIRSVMAAGRNEPMLVSVALDKPAGEAAPQFVQQVGERMFSVVHDV